jgi:hypothetical protein
MTTSQEAHRHLFVFSLVQKTTTNQASSPSSTTSKKKTRMKNKQIKRKVDVHLLATYALVFLEEHFLQHHFNNVFYNITSASATLLQHAYATLSFATTLQHCFYSTIFCNITFVVE